MSFSWVDVVFAAILALGTFKGFARGFIRELGGLVALAAAAIAPWYYNGAADGFIASTFHAGFFAHAIGMLATGIAAYLIVMVAVMVAGGIAKLPLLGLGNKIAGGAVGFVKAFVILWMLMFVVLFFPLGTQVRVDLHQSQLAPFVTAYSNVATRFLYAAIPPPARVFLQPAFDRHHL